VTADSRFNRLVWDRSGFDTCGVPRPMLKPVPRRRARRRSADRLLESPRMTPTLVEAPVREDLVARVRLEILSGTYDSPEKLSAALDRLADRLS
jgi:hypothetical protein